MSATRVPGDLYDIDRAVKHMDVAANELNNSMKIVTDSTVEMKKLKNEMDKTIASGFKGYVTRLKDLATDLRSAVKTCGNLENDVKAVLLERMPETVEFTTPGELEDPSLNDAFFVKRLADAVRGRTVFDRMRSYLVVARDLVKTRDSFRSKVEKLAERVKLTKAETPERDTALRKRREAETILRVLELRVAKVARMAFQDRARAMRTMKNLTELAYELLPHERAVRETVASTHDYEMMAQMVKMDLEYAKVKLEGGNAI